MIVGSKWPTGKALRPARIFVANYAGHDFSPARDYTSLEGEEAFVAVTQGSVDLRNTDRLIYTIRSRLADFQAQDYFVPCGNSLITSVALHELLSRLPRVNLLMYDGRGGYREQPVDAKSFQLPLSISPN